MMVTIYHNNKAIRLTDIKKSEDHSHPKEAGILYMEASAEKNLAQVIDKLKLESYSSAVVFHTDINQLKDNFFSHFYCIEAAGGLVTNNKNEMLLIFRRGKWDLPKGKMETGESAENCAMREIEEETGAGPLILQKKIGETYHIYEENGKSILKTSHWFACRCTGTGSLQPQTIEDITQAVWVPITDIDPYLSNTYPSIVDIVNRYLKSTN